MYEKSRIRGIEKKRMKRCQLVVSQLDLLGKRVVTGPIKTEAYKRKRIKGNTNKAKLRQLPPREVSSFSLSFFSILIPLRQDTLTRRKNFSCSEPNLVGGFEWKNAPTLRLFRNRAGWNGNGATSQTVPTRFPNSASSPLQWCG